MNHTEEIKILTQLGTEASQAAIAEYTRYYIISSACWAIACILVIWATIIVMKRLIIKKWDELDGPLAGLLVLVTGCILLAAVLGLFNQISDMLTPRAMAIHQLLKDLRGGS